MVGILLVQGSMLGIWVVIEKECRLLSGTVFFKVISVNFVPLYPNPLDGETNHFTFLFGKDFCSLWNAWYVFGMVFYQGS